MTSIRKLILYPHLLTHNFKIQKAYYFKQNHLLKHQIPSPIKYDQNHFFFKSKTKNIRIKCLVVHHDKKNACNTKTAVKWSDAKCSSSNLLIDFRE